MKLYKKAGEIIGIPIYDSATVTVGDRVKLANDAAGAGGIDAADAVTDLEFGICEGIVTNQGIPVDQAKSGELDGTVTNQGVTLTYAAAADNTTDKKVDALVRCFAPIYDAVSTATVGTTTGSNIPGYYIDIDTTDSTKVGETTASATVQNYLILGVHPDKPTTNLLVIPVMTQDRQ